MLKFWKKPGQREKQVSSNTSSPTKSQKSVGSPTSNGGSFTGSVTFTLEELEHQLSAITVHLEKSRLSRTLDEILNDTEALGYFIQYLEAVQCGSYIKFWLDVASFEASLVPIKCLDSKLSTTNDTDSSVKNHLLDEASGIQALNCDMAKLDVDCITDSVYTHEELNAKEKHLNVILHSQMSPNITDAIKIFFKYFSTSAIYKIVLPSEIKEKLVEKLDDSENLPQDVFYEAKDYVYTIFKKEHFNDFLRSEYHCKYQVEILTSNQVLISDILYNETALFYFMEYLEQEGCQCLLEFWLAANNFQQQYQCYPNMDPYQAQEDAVVLYDKYFSLQATSPLNLGDKIRLDIEESICREGGPLATCFDSPQKLITKILQLKYLDPFMTSELYFKYLSELIQTIHGSPVLCSKSGNSGGSDCSSELSISVTNTLLVSEDVNPPKKLYSDFNNTSIDTRQLYDPDSLWRRGNMSKLSFGSVDSLGRFKTDMEPEPDKKEGFRLTKAMKKLVNMEEDKSKEEMAWQVAAMIVKDVTTLTMSSNNE